MDMSLVAAVMMMQAASTQSQIATSVMKSNMNSEKDAVQTLLGIPSAPSTANLGSGIGGNLNVTA